MAYLDGTETLAEDKARPKFCPQCRGELVTRWVPHIRHTRRADPPYRAAAYPLFICTACQLSVQTATLPGKAMHATRKAATDAGNLEVRETFKRIANEKRSRAR